MPSLGSSEFRGLMCRLATAATGSAFARTKNAGCQRKKRQHKCTGSSFFKFFATTLECHKQALGYCTQHGCWLTNQFQELFENSHVQRRRSVVFWVELSADSDPIMVFAFDRFNHTIWSASRYAKTCGNFVDRHVVTTAHADFAFTINSFH